MQPQLVDELPLDRPTREFYRTMPAPARAWALAKAAFETAQEANFEEQRAAVKAATADDPEPPFYDQLPETATREDVRVAMDLWRAWSDRNRARVDAATKPIVARYRTTSRSSPNWPRDLGRACRGKTQSSFPRSLRRH